MESQRRASSIPPNRPNPFWSERAQQNFQLEAARPLELPKVPSDGEETSREGSVKSGRPVQDVERGRARSRSEQRQESRERRFDEGKYKTPPSEKPGVTSGRGKQTEGKVREKTGKGRGEKREREGSLELQRELEKEMVMLLRDQNAKLMAEVEELKARSAQASASDQSWSTISPTQATQPEPPQTPRPKPQHTGAKYTPGGTRVPEGPPPKDPTPPPPPPLPPLPPYPPSFLEGYESTHQHRRGARGVRDERPWQPAASANNMTDDAGKQGPRGVRNTLEESTEWEEEEQTWWTPPQYGDGVPWEGDGIVGRGVRNPRGEPWVPHESNKGLPKQYWGERFKPEPGHASATGKEAAAAIEYAAAEVNQRHYTQREVEQMIRYWEERSGGEGRQTKEREAKDDGLRSFPVTLPPLPEAHMLHASLEAGDWLTQIRPLIADVSGSAAEWWTRVEQETTQAYQQWLNSTPLGKLKIQPPNAEALAHGHERLAQRVGVMLMQAVPADMKKELVASRHMDAPNILFKIYKTYQPGGLAEKRQVLAHLTSTQPATNPVEAVSALRLWKRQAQRAKELKASVPDPVLQVRALMTVMEDLLAKDSQASFRVSSHRMTNGIDNAPTEEDIQLFYDLLLAEAEQMVTNYETFGSTTTANNTTGKPTVKAMQGSPGNTKQRETPCHWWGTEGGCRHGKGCKFAHDWQAVQDKAGRCWICSSTTHRRAECPALHKSDQLPAATGGSGAAGSSGGGEGKQESQKGKGGSKGKSKSKGKQPASQHTTPNNSPAKPEGKLDRKHTRKTTKARFQQQSWRRSL